MRILFITSTRIGDAVLSTGALAWALAKWPAARITVACGPEAAPLFDAVPRLDQVIVMRKQPYGGHWRRLWRMCVGKRWTAIIDLRRSAMPLTLLATRRYVLAKSDDTRHKVTMVSDMLGVRQPASPFVWIDDRHRAEADRLMGGHRPVLALAPTANWGGKEWPIERFIELVQRLTVADGMLAGAHVAVFSAPSEAARADRLIESLPQHATIDLRGKTDLLTAYACLKRADMFIGNDSALMHLAAASGTPTLGLFGPSKEKVYGPWGEHTAVTRTDLSFDEIINLPGYNHKSQETRMATLPVERVCEKAAELWQSSRLAQS